VATYSRVFDAKRVRCIPDDRCFQQPVQYKLRLLRQGNFRVRTEDRRSLQLFFHFTLIQGLLEAVTSGSHSFKEKGKSNKRSARPASDSRI
jgi:hypothetical protein